MSPSAQRVHGEANEGPEPGPDPDHYLIADPSTAALWPTAEQELLLRAAVMDGDPAVAAWDEWKATHDLVETHLDHGSFRLLPLVYRNLAAQRADEPLLPRLKGIYRYWWCSNQQLFYRAAGVVNGLESAGIPTLLLKGAALSPQFYRDTGVRPMGDIDLLVPYPRARAALDRLTGLGWQVTRPRVADLIRYQHCVRLASWTGQALDLHWHVLRECVDRDTDEGFWRRAVPVQVLEVRSLGLGPTDALLHTIVHGMRWNAEPTVRWIPDAMAILKASGGEIDWALLRDEARDRQMLLRVHVGLAYLRRAMGGPVPDAALALVREARPTNFERVEYRMLAFGSDGDRGIRPGHMLLGTIQYLRFVSGMSLRRTLAETPAYLRYRLRGRRGWFFDAVRAVRRWLRGTPARRAAGTVP